MKNYDSIEDVEGIIQLFKNDVLVNVAAGNIDLNDLAREELASRGLDPHGQWVGFEKAREACLHGIPKKD